MGRFRRYALMAAVVGFASVGPAQLQRFNERIVLKDSTDTTYTAPLCQLWVEAIGGLRILWISDSETTVPIGAWVTTTTLQTTAWTTGTFATLRGTSITGQIVTATETLRTLIGGVQKFISNAAGTATSGPWEIRAAGGATKFRAGPTGLVEILTSTTTGGNAAIDLSGATMASTHKIINGPAGAFYARRDGLVFGNAALQAGTVGYVQTGQAGVRWVQTPLTTERAVIGENSFQVYVLKESGGGGFTSPVLVFQGGPSDNPTTSGFVEGGRVYAGDTFLTPHYILPHVAGTASQVLTAISGSTVEWRTPSGGGGGGSATNWMLSGGDLVPTTSLTGSVIVGTNEVAHNSYFTVNRSVPFGAVFTYIGDTVTWTSNTVEAQSAYGTAFVVLADEDDDFLYVGSANQFTTIYAVVAVASDNCTLAAEYSTSTWPTLVFVDGTSNLQQDGSITFTAPADWATTTVNGVAGLYWVRLSTTDMPSQAPALYGIYPSSEFHLYVTDDSANPIGWINKRGDMGAWWKFNATTVTASSAVTGPNVTSGANPGHTHTGASLSAIDISADTNLAVTAPVVLTGDNLSIQPVMLQSDWPTTAATLVTHNALGSTTTLNIPGTVKANNLATPHYTIQHEDGDASDILASDGAGNWIMRSAAELGIGTGGGGSSTAWSVAGGDLVTTTAITGSVRPDADEELDLGESALSWKNGYFKGDVWFEDGTVSGTITADGIAVTSLTVNHAYTFPADDGLANQPLRTDGAGVVEFGGRYVDFRSAHLRAWNSVLGGGSQVNYGLTTLGTSGTASGGNDAYGGYRTFQTGALVGSVAGIGVGASDAFQTRWGGLIVLDTLTNSSVEDVRIWVGLSEIVWTGATKTDDVDEDLAAFWFSTGAGHTNWMCVTSDEATSTITDSGVAVAVNTNYLHEMEVTATSVKFYINGVLVATHTTNLPTNTLNLYMAQRITSLTAGAKIIGSRKAILLCR